MIGKIWKKIILFIIIVACLFDIVRKIVHKRSLQEELQATLDYFNAKNDKTQEQRVEQEHNPAEVTDQQASTQQAAEQYGQQTGQQQTTQTEQMNGQFVQNQNSGQGQTSASQQVVTPITQAEMEQIQQQYLQIQQQYQAQQQQANGQTNGGVVNNNGNQQ